MKKLGHLFLALLVSLSMSLPVLAKEGKSHHTSTSKHTPKSAVRSNKGGKAAGEPTGTARAKEVQALNKRADANRGFTTAPGLNKDKDKDKDKDADKSKKDKDDKSKPKKNKGGDKDGDESKDND